MPLWQLIATAGFGLEAVVARELRQLGYTDTHVTDGRVAFTGPPEAVCRANLFLRSCGRVLLKVGSFFARDFGELFEGTRALPWSEWLPVDAAFPVRGRSIRSQLHSVPDCQSIVKKAVVEHLSAAYGRTWFDETGPQYAVEVSLLGDEATLTLDTSGAGLHKRGYRTRQGPAPLKETLAAGLVQLSFWRNGRPLIDPLCGTGTIPIEAALLGRHLAPGLCRSFAAEAWPQIPAKFWAEARQEARDLARPRLDLPVIGTDINPEALRLARYHAERAGVAGDVHLQQAALADLRTSRQYGCFICNPPYGERLGERCEIEALYRQMGRVFGKFETWSAYVLTAYRGFERLYGRRADRRRKLYNGRLECTYYQFHGRKPPRRRVPVFQDAPQGAGD